MTLKINDDASALELSSTSDLTPIASTGEEEDAKRYRAFTGLAYESSWLMSPLVWVERLSDPS